MQSDVSGTFQDIQAMIGIETVTIGSLNFFRQRKRLWTISAIQQGRRTAADINKLLFQWDLFPISGKDAGAVQKARRQNFDAQPRPVNRYMEGTQHYRSTGSTG